jgi:hypothetical protein
MTRARPKRPATSSPPTGIPTLVGNRYTQDLLSGMKMDTGHDAIVGSIQVIVRDDSEVRRVEERRLVYLGTTLTASSFLLAR